MAINVQLLDQTLAHIETHPREWDQATWRCGTTYCFAGRAVVIAGSRWVKRSDRYDYESEFLLADDDDRAWAATASGLSCDANETIHVADRARRLLGLTEEQADDLFAGPNTLDDLRAMVADLKAQAESEAS